MAENSKATVLRTQGSVPGMWVIPNGLPGQLWTPHVFGTESEARAYWDNFWGLNVRPMPRTHTPVRATVWIEAVVEPVAARSPEGGT